MADWSDVLIPLAVALTQRNAKGAAFLEGYTGATRLREEQARRRGLDAQQAAYQQAQIDNMRADNERAAAQEARAAEEATVRRLAQALGALEPTIAMQGETATDPTAAENAILARTPALEGAFKLPPGQLSGFVPPMQPVISARQKKQAQATYADFTKQYGDRAGEAEATLRLSVGPFAGKTMAEIRQIAEALPPPPPKPPQRDLQSKEVFRNGQRAIVNFEPDTGKYFDLQDQPITDIAPIPPASQPGTGPNPRDVAVFNQIANAYDRSPLVRAADRTIVMDDAVTTIERTPTDPAAQLRLAYSYIQALDTYQSAVREGELGNLGALGTRLQQWGTQLNRVISEGAVMPSEVALNIARDARQLVQVLKDGSQRKIREYASRAHASGQGVGSMWDQFVAGAGLTPTTGRFKILSVK